MQNILVDEDGYMTGIVDWECVSAVPVWRACSISQLLRGHLRVDKPVRSSYAPGSGSHKDHDGELDNEGVIELYCIHLLKYERHELRKVFLDEIRAIEADCPYTR